MKLRSFGLVEAIISTAILLLFVTGIFYLTAKSSERLSNFLYEETARSYAEDFYSRVNVLSQSGRLDFKNTQSGDRVAITCLDSSKSADCASGISSGLAKDLYPFGNFIPVAKDEYLKISGSEDEVPGGYKIKTSVNKGSPGSWVIELNIIWKFNGMQNSYNLQRIINE